jgi:hypothetical protein
MMADTIVEACVSAAQFTLDNTVITEYKCAYCSELERKLKEVLEELSSTQLILKLLQEESTRINSVTRVGLPIILLIIHRKRN